MAAIKIVTQLMFHALLYLVPAVSLLVQHQSILTYFVLLGSTTLISLSVYHGFRWEIVGIRYRLSFHVLCWVFLGTSLVRNHLLLINDLLISIVCLGCLVGTVFFLKSYGNRKPVEKGKLELSSPLTARSVVAQGGNNRIHNAHRVVEAQSHALDLVVVDKNGARARGLAPRRLSDYHSFGSRVVAPIDGLVVKVRDAQEDLPIGTMDDGNPLGNFVLLHAKNRTLVLAHLMNGSISVQESSRVATGDAIGCVGNSGNTSEPHLHIHAVEGYLVAENAVISEARPTPLIVDSRYLRKGDIVCERLPGQ